MSSSVHPPTNGPFSKFCVQIAKPSDAQEILHFLFSDFLHNEPLNCAIELTQKECADFFSELVQIALVDGLSLLVRDPASGNKLIAVRLANIIRREGEMRENEVGVRNENGGEHRNGVGGEQRNGKQQKQRKKSSGAFREDREENEKVRQISGILHIVEDKIWSLVPSQIDTLLYWLVISVDDKYQRRGIASALLLHRLDDAIRMGCQGAITEASALNSQKLFAKLGYSRLFELMHSEFRNELGEQVFECPDGTDRVTLEFKQF